MENFVYVLAVLSTSSLPQRVASIPTDPPRHRYQLTEEEPVGTFVADVKTDFQLSDDALRFAVLTPDGELGQRLFGVDASSGVVRTVAVVDRDAICPGRAECGVDLDVGAKSPRDLRAVNLRVDISDVNDHGPRFPRTRVEYRVSEATQPGILFHLDPAEDSDGPEFGVTGYRLTSSSRHFDVRLPNPAAPFESPLLVLLEPLDREVQDLHQLKIVAADGGSPARTGSVLVDVVVTDVNDNAPRFTRDSYGVDVLENSPPSSSLLSVSATDPDLGPNADVVYAFSRQSTDQVSSVFRLDASTGVISSLKPLDFEETGSTLTFDVVASNADDGVAAVRTATARVTVNVIDVNDNRPSLRVDAAVTAATGSTSTGSGGDVIRVAENCPPDSVVAHLSVEDRDSGLGGHVECSLTGSSDHFRLVHIYDGEFQLLTSSTATLDRETADSYRLVIECRDNAAAALSSSVELDIEVEDVDDNMPQFSRAVYNFAVNESVRPGSVLGQVSATDADTSATAHTSTIR